MATPYRDKMVGQVNRAIAQIESEGARISFYSVAKRSQIARSTLYRRGDLRKLVVDAREGIVGSQSAYELNALEEDNTRLSDCLDATARRAELLARWVVSRARSHHEVVEYSICGLEV